MKDDITNICFHVLQYIIYFQITLDESNVVKYMKVVNDAERGVKLFEDYNILITNDEQQKQYLFQVLSNCWKRLQDKSYKNILALARR